MQSAVILFEFFVSVIWDHGRTCSNFIFSTNYCWWNTSCTSWYGKYLMIYRVLAPSQVVVSDLFHQQTCSLKILAHPLRIDSWNPNTMLKVTSLTWLDAEPGSSPAKTYTPGSTNIAGWIMDPLRFVFPIEHGEIPARYVHLLQANFVGRPSLAGWNGRFNNCEANERSRNRKIWSQIPTTLVICEDSEVLKCSSLRKM